MIVFAESYVNNRSPLLLCIMYMQTKIQACKESISSQIGGIRCDRQLNKIL
jgi:hypothetical protein